MVGTHLNLIKMNRFQIYKVVSNGRLMPIRSLLATSRQDAINQDKKHWYGGGKYLVTGLIKDIGEDISSDFPPHTQRRINNGGNKIKFKGTLYQYANEKATAGRKTK